MFPTCLNWVMDCHTAKGMLAQVWGFWGLFFSLQDPGRSGVRRQSVDTKFTMSVYTKQCDSPSELQVCYWECRQRCHRD